MSGGHEMVAAFEFKKDSSFKFYFIYGAVDRSASGKYEIKDGNIILHAHKKPGHDFTIVHQKKQGDGTSIKISNANTILLRNIVGIFKKGNTEDLQHSNNEGFIHSKLGDCDSVLVLHELFPDVPTIVRTKETTNKNNYFELTLNPSLSALSFKDFTLLITTDGLTGSLPWLFERDKVVFVKEGN